jgi:hypothetical protein
MEILSKKDFDKAVQAAVWNGLSGAIVAIPVIVSFELPALKATALVIATAFVNGFAVGLKKWHDSLQSPKKSKD